eukprot:COSAG05_NODE_1220_length_5477_cov_485.217739_2_plen_343_part_00
MKDAVLIDIGNATSLVRNRHADTVLILCADFRAVWLCFQKRCAALPASGDGRSTRRKLDVRLKRQALEELYQTYVVLAEDDEGCRTAERRIARKAGMDQKYLKRLVKEMPAGLVNDEQHLTLRRAANAQCGIKNDKTKFTSSELRSAVLASFQAGTTHSDVCNRFGVGRTALYKHRSHLVAWRRSGGKDDGASVCLSLFSSFVDLCVVCADYFSELKSSGRPPVLWSDEEAIASETCDLAGATGIGKQYHPMKQYLAGLTLAATGKKGGGSQSHVRSFIRRNAMTDVKGSDLSQIRAKALTPEKHALVRLSLPVSLQSVCLSVTNMLVCVCITDVQQVRRRD